MGEEDRSTCGCRRRALSLAIKARTDVVVDLRDLSYTDSSLLVDLAVLARRLRHNGRNLRLLGAQPQVQRLIERMGVDRLPAVALVS
jgi:anti-anti-sigma factor